MLRAAVDGVIDYRQYDPDDPWWEARHNLLLLGLEAKLHREMFAIQHQHHCTFAAANFTPESITQQAEHAKHALNSWLRQQLPWEADRIGTTRSTEEQLVEDFRKRVGEPGTPEYEEILQELDRALRPISQAEKLRLRQERRRARQRREHEAIQRGA